MACAKYGLRRDARAPHEVQAGYDAFSGKPVRPDYFTKKWLGLRLNAVKRGMVLSSAVNPSVLKKIIGKYCIISLARFDLGQKSPLNPSIDRIANEGTYAIANLCAVTQRVNRAKGDKSFEEVAEIAQAGEAVDHLEAVEWMRLAALMYGTWDRLSGNRDPYIVPFPTYPPPHVLLAESQVVQLLLLRAARKTEGPLSDDFWSAVLSSTSSSQYLGDELMNALLAALGMEEFPPSVWLHEKVFNTFVEWYSSCKPAIQAVLRPLHQKHQTGINIDQMVEGWAVGQRKISVSV